MQYVETLQEQLVDLKNQNGIKRCVCRTKSFPSMFARICSRHMHCVVPEPSTVLDSTLRVNTCFAAATALL